MSVRLRSMRRRRIALALILCSLALPASSQTPWPAVQLGHGGFKYGTWPADFNENGTTDLIGADRAGTNTPDLSLGVTLDAGTSSPAFRSLGLEPAISTTMVISTSR